jgi:hypothetical protein
MFYLHEVNRLFFVFLLFISFYAVAGGSPARSYKPWFDRYSIPQQYQGTLDSLCRYVNQTYPSDTDRVNAYFSWIATHISYDMAAYRNNNIKGELQLPRAVFRDRKAVCAGYAALMQYCCEKSDVRIVTLSGYSKGAGYHKDSVPKLDDMTHAWNAVKLNGTWQLLDVTWASGNIDYRDTAMAMRYRYGDPLSFLSAHYPEDPMWQLSFHPLHLTQWLKPRYEYFVPGFRDTTLNYIALLKEYEESSVLQRELISSRRIRAFNRAAPDLPEFTMQSSNGIYNKAVVIYRQHYTMYEHYFREVHVRGNYHEVSDTTWQYYRLQIVEAEAELDTLLLCIDTGDVRDETGSLRKGIAGLRLWSDREIMCIDRYTGRKGLARRVTPFYPYHEPFFYQHLYTRTYEYTTVPALRDSVDAYIAFELVFPCIPTYGFAKTNILFGMGVHAGFRRGHTLYSTQMKFFGGPRPSYGIRNDKVLYDANTNGCFQMSLGAERYIYLKDRKEYFITGKAGFSVLDQYYEKQKPKDISVSSTSPLLAAGFGFYHRVIFARSIRVCLEYGHYFHSANGVNDISGGMIMLGVAYGLGGNGLGIK